MAEPSQIWRIPAPATLLLGLGLFALPWIEVTCSLTPRLEKAAARTGQAESEGRIVVLTQTGWQALIGEFTVGEAFQGLSAGGSEREKAPAADMLIGLIVACGAGVLFGLFLPVGSGRRALVGLCVLSAVGALTLQTVIQFPAKKRIDSERAKIRIPDPAELPADARPEEVAEVKAEAVKAAAALELAPAARYTPYFFAVWGLLIVGLLAVIVEAYIASEGSARSTPLRHQFLDS